MTQLKKISSMVSIDPVVRAEAEKFVSYGKRICVYHVAVDGMQQAAKKQTVKEVMQAASQIRKDMALSCCSTFRFFPRAFGV